MATAALDFSKMNALELKATIYSYIEKFQDREKLQDWAEALCGEADTFQSMSETITVDRNEYEVLKLKNDIIEKLVRINDEESLLLIYNFIKELVEKNKG